MAQLRPEVRPLVSSMPVDGFGLQTGGSARRRVVPFDTAMNSYKVTGVPGHTHNASAVCSVLVDNTERSNAEFRITPAPRIEEETPPEGTSPAAESPASEPATQEMMVSDASTPFSLQAPMPVVN